MTYTDTLQYLYDRLPVFHHVGGAAYKPGLDNTIQLMNVLDNPQTKYRCIHIAGTNGKGSVSNMMAAVLQTAGYKVGLYTSPHLVDFGERIRVNGQMIEQQYVIDFVENNKDVFNTIEPSFFEATMAMAFNYFADTKVDVAIIEVGLGGRLDSTNIIQPDLSVITNISFDHVGFLGDTLEKIAFEKAGIIKPTTPVVIGESTPETHQVFVQKACKENAALIFAEERFNVTFKEYSDAKMLVEINGKSQIKCGLCGNYQLKNIATTLAAIEQLNTLNYSISESDILNGFENITEITSLQGRWQTLRSNPTVVCDTGHNVGGIQFVVEQLKAQSYKKLRIVIGMVNDKDISAVLNLLPKDAVYYFTQANIIRALSCDELKLKAETFSLNGDVYKTVKQAVDAAINESESDDFIFIGGSNFIVGEALPLF
jgi:dihydrofolate synthase / folylpolyglutamate synthase